MNFLSPPVPKAPIALRSQDLEALRFLSLKGYRYMTCEQIAVLLGESHGARCAKMSEFESGRLVKALRLSVTTGSHQSETVYTLARLGAVVLSEKDGLDVNRLYSRGGYSYLFLRHALAITGFRLALETALRNADHRLLSWRSEWELRALHLRVHLPGRVRQRALPFVPDALFGITTAYKPRYFFLEMDRGTADAKEVARKILAYVEFFRSGRHRTLFGLPYFRVLIVTTTRARMHGLLTFTKDIRRCPNMFLFLATGRGSQATGVIASERLLGRIWHRCNSSSAFSLSS